MTPLDATIYNLTQQLQGAIWQAAASQRETPPPSPPPLLQVRRGYAESPAWMLVQAREFDPEPINVELIRKRAVWSAESIIQALLEMLAGERWLERTGDAYALTPTGRDLIEERSAITRQMIEGFTAPLPLEQLEQLENSSQQILDQSLKSDKGAWSLAHSRNRFPPQDASALVKLVAHGSDFNAFRDDAHMAAFAPFDIEAYIWETLTGIWQGDVSTPDAAFDALYYRGYTRADYQHAFAELTRRGWIESADAGYQITDVGRQIREDAERQTDAYFFAPWQILSAEEQAAFINGMQSLKAGCEALYQS